MKCRCNYLWSLNEITFFFQKSERDWNRLKRALNDEEMATVIANQTNIEKKIDTLRKLYDSLILDYKIVIDRLKIFTDLS